MGVLRLSQAGILTDGKRANFLGGLIILKTTVAYFAGGSSIRNDGPGLTTVDKFVYLTNTRSTLGTGLTANSYEMAATNNTGTAGYVSLRGTALNKFSLPSDTRSTLSNSPTFRFTHAGAENDGVAGYFMGGYDSGFNRLSSITKMDYSNDSISNIATTLSAAKNDITGMSDDGVALYVAGGTAGGANLTSVDKIAVPVETRTTLATGLTAGNRTGAGFHNKGVAGYIAGGDGLGSAVNKFAFPTDTRSSTSSLSAVSRWQFATEQNGVKAFVALGVDNNDTVLTTMNEYAFPTDTRTSTITLSSARRAGAGASA